MANTLRKIGAVTGLALCLTSLGLLSKGAYEVAYNGAGGLFQADRAENPTQRQMQVDKACRHITNGFYWTASSFIPIVPVRYIGKALRRKRLEDMQKSA